MTSSSKKSINKNNKLVEFSSTWPKFLFKLEQKPQFQTTCIKNGTGIIMMPLLVGKLGLAAYAGTDLVKLASRPLLLIVIELVPAAYTTLGELGFGSTGR